MDVTETKVIKMKSKSNIANYLGWAASLALMIGIVYQYQKQEGFKNQIVTVEKEKQKLGEEKKIKEEKYTNENKILLL